MKVNKNYKNIAQSYLFSTIAQKVNEFTKKYNFFLINLN